MAFVTGEPRRLDETPGILPEESLKQIMLDIEASKKKRQTDYRIPESEPCPDGPPPEGYHNPKWSNSEKRWFCQATQGEHRFLIWDKDKASWIEWAKFQEERQNMAPLGHRALGDTSVPASFFRRITTFITRARHR